MQTCERCGKQIPDRMSVCPSCGTVSYDSENAQKADKITYEETISNEPYHTAYGQYKAQSQQKQQIPSQYIPPNQTYQQPGFQQQIGYQPTPKPYAQPQIGFQPAPGPYAQPQFNVHIINNHYSQTQYNVGALIIEILLSLIGIYGVGWLIADKKLPGILLLLGSIFVYWPMCIAFVVLTLGLGIFCLLPMSIAAIIINAVLLNNTLKRKAQGYMPPPFAPAPPRF
jgi:hypothetical protein